MPREALLGGQPPAGDDSERDLRPQRMHEMVGQRAVFERLQIAVDAATKRQEPLGHMLFDGPPGLGKTTFALCLPREMQVPVQLTSGATLQAPKDLIPYLTNAEERSVLFIDEIHRLPKAVEEYLYTAMEDFRIDIVHGEGTHARTWLTPVLARGDWLLVEATIHLGFRHQIRAHLAHAGYPIAGDDLYGGPKIANLERLFLHAAGLKLPHPLDDRPLEITSDLPAELAAVLARVGSETSQTG